MSQTCSCDVEGKGAVKTPCGAAKIVEEWLEFMGQLQRECMHGAGPRVREAGLHILTVAQMVSPQTFDVKYVAIGLPFALLSFGLILV